MVHLHVNISGHLLLAYLIYNCPCSSGSPQSVPSFIGNYCFCDSGNSDITWTKTFYASDPLWNGDGCESFEQDCCSASGLPWFHKPLTLSSTKALEMHFCATIVVLKIVQQFVMRLLLNKHLSLCLIYSMYTYT